MKGFSKEKKNVRDFSETGFKMELREVKSKIKPEALII
jgi:hypothetical protein